MMRLNKLTALLLCLPVALGPSCSLLTAGVSVADAEEAVTTAELEKGKSDTKITLLEQEKAVLERRLAEAEGTGELFDVLEAQLIETEKNLTSEKARNGVIEADLAYERGRADGAMAAMNQVGDQITAGASLAAGPPGGLIAQATVGIGSALAIAFGRAKALKSLA